jgi:hypothetical protein
MAGAVEFTLSDLEAQFDASMVKRVFCDNGNGRVGPRLTSALSVARRVADALLLAAWSQEQIEVLVTEDDAVRSAILDLALSEGMKGKLEWDVAGGVRERMRKAAIENLNLLAQGKLRSVAEAAGAGRNPHTKPGEVNTQRTPHTFIFAPTKARPNRGGF